MLSGGGANLHQQWGLQPWVDSALMAVLVLIVGSMNVAKVTNVLGAITPPFVLILLLLAVGAAFIDPPSGLQQAHEFASVNVESPLPFWWVATLNYLGLSLMALALSWAQTLSIPGKRGAVVSLVACSFPECWYCW